MLLGISYLIMDAAFSFFIGLVIGIVLYKMFAYMILLILTIGSAIVYFMKRGLITFSFHSLAYTIQSSIWINYHAYLTFLAGFFSLGFIVGIVSAWRSSRKRKKKEISEELSSGEL